MNTVSTSHSLPAMGKTKVQSVSVTHESMQNVGRKWFVTDDNHSTFNLSDDTSIKVDSWFTPQLATLVARTPELRPPGWINKCTGWVRKENRKDEKNVQNTTSIRWIVVLTVRVEPTETRRRRDRTEWYIAECNHRNNNCGRHYQVRRYTKHQRKRKKNNNNWALCLPQRWSSSPWAYAQVPPQ